MDLSDRYINEVVRRLPEQSRTEVEMELRANIGDMLPERPAEGDVVRVLRELGDPARLADEYRQAKRYLIGPALYDTYISVLRIVISIVAVVTAGGTLVSGAADLPWVGVGIASSSMSLFWRTVGAAFEGAASAFLWVTLTFALVSRSGLDMERSPFRGREWSPDQLLTVAVSRRSRISRVETIVNICLLVAWTAVICLAPQVIAVYARDGGAWTATTPLFDLTRLGAFIPGIAIFAFLNFCVLTMMLVTERWNIAIAVSNAIHKIGSGVFYFGMIGDASLFNADFQRTVADTLNIGYGRYVDAWHLGILSLQAVIVFGTVVDVATGFFRSRR